MTEFFGDIRELLQRGQAADARALAQVLWRARCASGLRYDAQILPYLEGFELPTFEFFARWQLERLDVLLPARASMRWRLDDVPGSGEQVELLIADVLLARVTELVVHVGSYLDSARVCALLGSAHLEGLRSLHLEGTEVGSQVLRALAGSHAIAHIDRLSIENSSYNQTLIPGMRALLEGTSSRRLTHLEYAPYSLSEGGDCAVNLIAKAPFRRLEHVKLRGYNDRFDVQEASALAQAPWLGGLRSLDLSHCELEPEALAEIVRAPGSARLCALNLGDNNLGGEGVRVLTEATHLTRVKSLNLWRNQIQNAGFERVLRSALMARLQVLNVRGNWIDAHGAQALCDVSPGRPLRTLLMGHNALGDEGACVLFGSGLCAGLERLGLQSNGIESRGVEAIEAMDGRLEELLLDFNEPGERGVGALARSRATRRLHRLSLMWCVIEDEGLDALARAGFVRHLRQLDLSHNALSTQAMVNFLESGGLERIEQLSLSGNRLGDEVLVTMLQTSWFEHLTKLDVRHNRLGQEAIEHLERVDVHGAMPRIEYAGNAHEEHMARVIDARQSFLGRALPE